MAFHAPNRRDLGRFDDCGRAGSRRRPERGFTLIELLVAIAIVGVLVAILLPAIEAARHQARVVQCAAQLHEHGVAHAAWQADHEGYFPNFAGAPHSGTWTYSPSDVSYAATAIQLLPGANRFPQAGATPQRPRADGTPCMEKYMNAPTRPEAVGTPQDAFFCPTIQWRGGCGAWPSGPLHTRFPQRFGGNNKPFGTLYAHAGYSFFTGRKKFRPGTGGDGRSFDTRLRRSDPKEILVTDVLEVNYKTDTGPCGATMDATVPWFNPHVGPRNRKSATGSAHQLVADGHVARVDLASPESGSITMAFEGNNTWNHYFVGEMVDEPEVHGKGGNWFRMAD